MIITVIIVRYAVADTCRTSVDSRARWKRCLISGRSSSPTSPQLLRSASAWLTCFVVCQCSTSRTSLNKSWIAATRTAVIPVPAVAHCRSPTASSDALSRSTDSVDSPVQRAVASPGSGARGECTKLHETFCRT